MRKRDMLALYVLAIEVVAAPLLAIAADHDHNAHEHDMQAMKRSPVKRSVAHYAVPNVPMVRDDGVGVTLPAELDDGRPVFLAFIYTTCTTICPLTSQTFASFQESLGKDVRHVHLVSISIDPEQDTPARLHAYAKRYQAGPEWQHYTGSVGASVAVQRAFDVYGGDKMNHNPVFFVRAAPNSAWVRLDGFADANDLEKEYHALEHGG